MRPIGTNEDSVNAFVEAIRKLPQVVECHLMAGDCDFLLGVVAPDLEGYRRFQIEHLGRIEGITHQDRNSDAEDQALVGNSGLMGVELT